VSPWLNEQSLRVVELYDRGAHWCCI
jgi:hypothetical protein